MMWMLFSILAPPMSQDYKLPLHSKGYAEIWKDNWISEYGVKR